MTPTAKGRAAASAGPASYVVVYDEDAASELAEIRDKALRRAVLASVEKLRLLGSKTIEPHAKKVEGAKSCGSYDLAAGRARSGRCTSSAASGSSSF
ncbi:hypothetical protein [Miltoncostaea marina]|uniref:hypothetical protein n=1 Tax=Miltoncostaea marina TaxID=2843215 RepID=UPI001C3DC7C7|nr:hypothetical protein [Miltoncostaea marina]